MKIMITGCAGFIGMHTALHYLEQGDEVIGVDNLNHYYEITLKEARLNKLTPHPLFQFHKLNVADQEGMTALFAQEKPQKVIHLAAQAGVRYSLENPHAYVESNLQGFMNILENCRHHGVEHLVYASSSSVYGSNACLPFDEAQNVDHPISLYAATKKANELMAHTYSHLYNLPTTGLRFFTVYGPWSRPDMALLKFTHAIVAGEPINLFNSGKMVRDFTYIDDIVEGIARVTKKPATSSASFDTQQPDPSISDAPYRIFNIGNSQPTQLLDYIHVLEEVLGIEAKKNYLPMQPGDVLATSANTEALAQWVGFQPRTSVAVGVQRFVEWYRSYYKS
jgi:UDP-glucuronate 4-epimerase